MRKILKTVALAAILLLPLTGCNDNPGTEEITVQEQIDAGGIVDLKGETISEDVVINKTVTLQNANFDGHTITVNANATLYGIKNANVVVAKEGISLDCNDSEIISLDVGKGSARTAETSRASASGYVTIKIKASTVATITVNVENVKITSYDKVKIELLAVRKEAEDVSISGSEIETLQAIKNSIFTISNGANIAKVTVVKANGSASNGTIKVNASEDVIIPSTGIEKVTIKSAVLEIGSTAKKEYEVNDSFNFTGLSVEVTYSDGLKKTLPLSRENATTTFKSSQVGEISVSFTYNGIKVVGSLPVTIKPTSKKYLQLLNEAVDCFAEMDFDNGLAKIQAAYNDTKNDTTKMYYALAMLALVSTKQETVDFMKTTCGFESYPNTLNALILPFIDGSENA